MSTKTDSFVAISSADLSTALGGAGQTFADYAGQQRKAVAEPYRQVVCTAAGVKGAKQLGQGVYGDKVGDTDVIRAAEMLKSYCLGGASLPAEAPQSPF